MNKTSQAVVTILVAGAAALAGTLAGALAGQAQSKEPVPEVYKKTPAVEPGHAPKLSFKEVKPTGRVFKVGNSTGDEVMSGLAEFAEKNHVGNAEVSGLGGFISAVLAMYDPGKGGFKTLVVDQKCEVSAFTGTIAMQNGRANVHAHVVLGCVDGITRSGHLIEGHVNPVMDLYVKEYEDGPTGAAK